MELSTMKDVLAFMGLEDIQNTARCLSQYTESRRGHHEDQTQTYCSNEGRTESDNMELNEGYVNEAYICIITSSLFILAHKTTGDSRIP
jgi:hypothetical protein